MRHGPPPVEPVWRVLERTSIGDGCWVYQGASAGGGYGQVAVGKTGRASAHIVVFEFFKGPVPTGLQLDHVKERCSSRLCVRPDHLEPVTCRENLLRGDTLAARNAAKTHCPRQHPYSEENTYLLPSGGRACRACRAEASRRYKKKGK